MKTEGKQRGFVLILSMLVLATLMMVGSYLVSVSNSENKIATSQFLASKDYYLAETGINEMLWKIKNNTSTRQAFLNGSLGVSDNISRANVFNDSRASYAVSAKNTTAAEAWVTATSTYAINSYISQRVVKSYVAKATGNGSSWQFSVFSGGQGSQQNAQHQHAGSQTHNGHTQAERGHAVCRVALEQASPKAVANDGRNPSQIGGGQPA